MGKLCITLITCMSFYESLCFALLLRSNIMCYNLLLVLFFFRIHGCFAESGVVYFAAHWAHSV